MDRAKLEELIARLANATSRRKTVQGILGGALASAAALAETAAKGKKQKQRKAGKNDGQGKDRGGNGKGKGKNRKDAGKGKARAKDRDLDQGKVKAKGTTNESARDGDDARNASPELGAEGRAGGRKRCKKNGRNCRQLQVNVHVASN